METYWVNLVRACESDEMDSTLDMESSRAAPPPSPTFVFVVTVGFAFELRRTFGDELAFGTVGDTEPGEEFRGDLASSVIILITKVTFLSNDLHSSMCASFLWTENKLEHHVLLRPFEVGKCKI